MESLLISLHILIISSIAYLLWRKHRDPIFWPALIFKLAAGILVGLLYRYYYATGDTWNYYNSAVKLVEQIQENPGSSLRLFWTGVSENEQPRSLYLEKWTAAFNLLNSNSYWITSLYFSLISFFGAWVLYRTLITHFSNRRMEAALSILFVPSIVFWGSGIIKESLAIGTLYGLTACFLTWYFKRSLSLFSILGGLFSFWILWNLKYYWVAVWFAVFIPVMACEILSTKVNWINRNPKWSWTLLLLVALVGVSLIRPNFYYNNLLAVIVENHDAYVTISSTNDVIHYYNLQPNIWSMLINAPWALVSGVFRPFIWEVGTVLQAAASVENLTLLILFGVSLYKIKKKPISWNPLHLAIAAYILILAIFLALSTPNFGSLSRFKIGFTPFLWFVLLCVSGVLSKFKTRTEEKS
jgi:hypothetical protein